MPVNVFLKGFRAYRHQAAYPNPVQVILPGQPIGVG